MTDPLAPPDAPETTLRRLAEQATDGPWHLDSEPGFEHHVRTFGTASVAPSTGTPIADCAANEDAAYIAAANPTALLSLLAAHAREVETARNWDQVVAECVICHQVVRRRERLIENRDDSPTWHAWCYYQAKIDAAEARATTLTAQLEAETKRANDNAAIYAELDQRMRYSGMTLLQVVDSISTMQARATTAERDRDEARKRHEAYKAIIDRAVPDDVDPDNLWTDFEAVQYVADELTRLTREHERLTVEHTGELAARDRYISTMEAALQSCDPRDKEANYNKAVSDTLDRVLAEYQAFHTDLIERFDAHPSFEQRLDSLRSASPPAGHYVTELSAEQMDREVVTSPPAEPPTPEPDKSV